MSSTPLAVRVTALGFVFNIFFGSFWIIYLLLGTSAPALVTSGFYLGVLTVFVGGLMMLVRSLRKLMS